MINKIFGIGLSRTGTGSLTNALKNLGYKTIHFPRLSQLEQLANEYNAMTDTTVAYKFKMLDKKFPHSKFILTIREKNSWINSVEKLFKTFRNKVWRGGWVDELHKNLYHTKVFKKNVILDAYDNHYNKVMKYFENRPNDLLVMNIVKGDGYEKLINFLYNEFKNKKFPHKGKGENVFK